MSRAETPPLREPDFRGFPREDSGPRAELLQFGYLAKVLKDPDSVEKQAERLYKKGWRTLHEHPPASPHKADLQLPRDMEDWLREFEAFTSMTKEPRPTPLGLRELQLKVPKVEQDEKAVQLADLREAVAIRLLGLRSNESAARRALKEIAVAQDLFRLEDADRNDKADCWVLDVAGLHRIVDRHGQPIALLAIDIAQADLAPGPPATLQYSPVGPPRARSGYRFARIESCIEGGEAKKYDDGSGRNPGRYGFCAVPEEPGVSGDWTFILDERQVIWRRDTGGKVPAVFPADPEKEGWGR